METRHEIIFADSTSMVEIDDQSVQLVVTSPPYPMIEMWDELFSEMDRQIGRAIKQEKGYEAYEKMHCLLDQVWKQLARVLSPGGIACINIGDAVRSIGGRFSLFANHARIIAGMQNLGFDLLPTIIWRKPTNSPTKFMGSGMLPPSAYATLEHEFILVFRKGGARQFKTSEDKERRRISAFFWEERNKWFTDVWLGLTGTDQTLNGTQTRKRSAAFPLELAYRLINMYSIQGDLVLDPFLGTGTTMEAAMAAGRNSLGIESDPSFKSLILQRISGVPETANVIGHNRLDNHIQFTRERQMLKGPLKHWNSFYDFAVVTSQETGLRIPFIKSITYLNDNRFKISHEYRQDWFSAPLQPQTKIFGKNPTKLRQVKARQPKLFPS